MNSEDPLVLSLWACVLLTWKCGLHSSQSTFTLYGMILVVSLT